MLVYPDLQREAPGMKKFLRRSGAALLAACTVWTLIVTVESRSVPAALAAMRSSFHLPNMLMQLALGDLTGEKEMSLSTLLCLGQSPLLWAGYGNLPDPPQPDIPAEETAVPDAPADTDDLTQGLTFADNGAPSQTVIPTSPKSYTVAGNVYIKNGSDHTLDPAAFDGTFPAQPGDRSQPQVLILHTHGSEAYTMPAGEEYEASGSYRTMDTTKNMIRVGDEIAAVLSRYGLSVLHDRQIHDTDYNSAYDKSYDSAAAYLEKYPSISFVLDIHRDAISDADGNQYKLVSQEDPRAAQLSIIMGSNYDAWLSNLRLAVAVQSHLAHDHPTLMRPITLRWYGYNQSLSTGSLLVEVGAAGNSLDEAIYAARLFARGFAETLGCTEPGNPSSPSA